MKYVYVVFSFLIVSEWVTCEFLRPSKDRFSASCVISMYLTYMVVCTKVLCVSTRLKESVDRNYKRVCGNGCVWVSVVIACVSLRDSLARLKYKCRPCFVVPSYQLYCKFSKLNFVTWNAC